MGKIKALLSFSLCVGCGNSDYEITSGGLLFSPNYPERYPANTDCSNVIRAKPGQIIRLHVEKFEVGINDGGCGYELGILCEFSYC